MDETNPSEVNNSLYFNNGSPNSDARHRDHKVSEYAYFGFLAVLGVIALVVLLHCIISCLRNMCAQHDLNVLDRQARSQVDECRECYPQAFEPKPCSVPPMTFDPDAIYDEAKEDACCEDPPEVEEDDPALGKGKCECKIATCPKKLAQCAKKEYVPLFPELFCDNPHPSMPQTVQMRVNIETEEDFVQFLEEQRRLKRVTFACGPPEKRYIPRFPSDCECGSSLTLPLMTEPDGCCDEYTMPSEDSCDDCLPACDCEPGRFYEFQLPTRIVDCLDECDLTELREEGYPRRMGLPVEFEDFTQPRMTFGDLHRLSQPRSCCSDLSPDQSGCCCDDLVPPSMPIQGGCCEEIEQPFQPRSCCNDLPPAQYSCDDLIPSRMPIQGLCFEGIDQLGEPESFGPEFAPLLRLGCNCDESL